jgi:hypothetical protein
VVERDKRNMARFKKLQATTSNEGIAKIFKVSSATIIRWRKKHGCLNGHKGKWSRTKHPKGFLGGRHSDEQKKKQSNITKKMWADQESTFNSKPYRRKLRDRMAKQAVSRLKKAGNNIYSRCKRGRREDLGDIFFRSRWEANIARYLNLLIKQKDILKWEYETETFWFESIRRGVRSYTPDFKVWPSDGSEPYFVEVKGWMDAKSATKLKRMAKYYPNIKIKLIDQKTYNSIRASLGPIIEEWER